jgi:hypothetical protein
MPLVPASTLLEALKARLAAIKIDDTTGNDEPLFEMVATYANKKLGAALSDLFIFKQRVCLIVPIGVKHVHSLDGVYVTSLRWLHVDLLMSDRAYFQAAQKAIEGADKNIGTLAMGERVEAALTGVDLTAWGPAVFDDGAPLEISNEQAKTAPGRECWIQSLALPAGDSR